MSFSLRRFVCMAALAAAMTGGSAPASASSSPDFYGIKMNSENHARDLAPDELALFPVRRGFDKNVYAYGHIDTTFNNTRSITFDIFNNTDNDLLIEKSFREYYVVLRNGERYRLNEPGLSMSVDRIAARNKGRLRADFGSLNVTKEQIEMVVCSFDMGKVKIVLLPIALDPPPPLPAQEAARMSAPSLEKDPAGVYARDQVHPRLRGENEIKQVKPGRGRFPVMDLPIFSWLKSASSRPDAELKTVTSKSSREMPADSKKAADWKRSVDAAPAPPKPSANISPKSAAPATEPVAIEPVKPVAEKPVRRGLFGSLFSIFDPNAKRAPASFDRKGDAKKPADKAAKISSASKPAAEKEFFWKPRDLDPIEPIEPYQKKKDSKDKKDKPGKAESKRSAAKTPAEAEPFYMRRALDDSVRVPRDEPVTAVSGMNAKKKAPVLKPVKKLRAVGPRTDAKVVQVNPSMGFIIVNAGLPDGIRENMVLNVYRRGKIIAKAVVRKANEDASAAMLMKEWAREDVAVGDPVSFY